MRSLHNCEERGAITVWTAVALIGFVLIVGIGVDFSGQARAAQEARGIAREAARAGGQYVRTENGSLYIEPESAKRAAENYVAASRFHGTAEVVNGKTIRVEVSGEYTCVFLKAIGITTLPVRGEGAANPGSYS
jgi:hypothetical protein